MEWAGGGGVWQVGRGGVYLGDMRRGFQQRTKKRTDRQTDRDRDREKTVGSKDMVGIGIEWLLWLLAWLFICSDRVRPGG